MRKGPGGECGTMTNTCCTWCVETYWEDNVITSIATIFSWKQKTVTFIVFRGELWFLFTNVNKRRRVPIIASLLNSAYSCLKALHLCGYHNVLKLFHVRQPKKASFKSNQFCSIFFYLNKFYPERSWAERSRYTNYTHVFRFFKK